MVIHKYNVNRVKKIVGIYSVMASIILTVGDGDAKATAPADAVFVQDVPQEIAQEIAYSNLYVSSRDEEAVRVSIDVEEKYLLDLLHELAKEVRVDISIQSENISNTKVSYSAKHETIYTILDDILAENELEYSLHNDRKLLIIKNRFEEEAIQRTVTGRVTDSATGESLPGVNIVIEGTSRGAVTDIEGEYSLSIDDSEAVLIFSYIGYSNQTVSIGNRESIDISLEQDLGRLDEVIVVGYGTVEKSDLTGSVMRVRGEDFRTQSMTQVTDMLAGTVAGFYGQQATSAAGGSSMEIRGPNSLSAGTSPLVVLDGVIYNGSLRDINTNDIESIDILKDASSSAIYGAKAASGVILITTSRGRSGPPTINFSSKTGWAGASNHWRPLSGDDYLKMRGEYFRAQQNFSGPQHYYTRPDQLPDHISIDEWRGYSDSPNADNTLEYLHRHELFAPEVDQYLSGNEVNWYDMVMQQGLRQDYDLNIGGGTDNTNYYWSIGYVDNEGMILGDQFSAIRSRLNVDYQVTDWFSAGLNAQYTNRDESVVQANLARTGRASPFGRDRNEDGSLNLIAHGHPTTYHPLMEYFGADRHRKATTIFASLFAEVELPFGINYRMSVQPRSSFLKDYNFYGDQHSMGFGTYENGYGTRHDSETFEWMVDNLLKWNRDFGVHHFDVTLLYNIERLNSWSSDISNQTFSPNLQLGYHALQFGNNPTIQSNDTEAKGDAVMARLNYTLMGKYLFTGSVRRDGYSAFGQENPRATFPALAFAWQIAEEDFFNVNFVNQLKLRLSWGINGNRDIGIYSSLANIQDIGWYDGSAVQIGVYNSRLANPGLRWERTEATNIGLDIGLLQSRIDLSLDYYQTSTNDLLMNRILPQITGFSSIMANLGELENRGFELTLSTVNVNTPTVNWSSNLIFSLNRNKIKSLFGDVGEYTINGETRHGELPDYSNQWFPGQSIDVIWGYDVEGTWKTDEADEAAVYGLLPGDFRAVDVNEDGDYTETEDKQFIGHTSPRYRFGFRNNVDWRNFSASVFIRADLGHMGLFNKAYINGDGSLDRHSMGDPVPYWTPENQIDSYSRLESRSRNGSYGGGLNIYRDRSFLRIQDVSISYTVPESVSQIAALSRLRFYGSIRNVATFTKWPDWDPESGSSPMPRVFTLGIDLSI